MDRAGLRALLDPEVAVALAAMERVPPLRSVDDVAELRAARDERTARLMLEWRLPEGVTRDDYLGAGRPGDPDLGLAVFCPTARSGPSPCLYWMHGGGYVMGSHDGDAPRVVEWVQKGWTVVSVGYRLAPETPYPGPLEDAYAGLRWTSTHADELGIDPACLVIGGASAGAGLAAGLGLLARDRAEIALRGQLLIYPMIDDRQSTETSTWPVPIWDPVSNLAGWQAYLGPLHGTEAVPAYAAAARATDLRGLPPTIVVVGTLDGFCDEDIAYAQRLNHAGVPTELHVYPGAPHGFDLFAPETAIARRSRADINRWLDDISSGPGPNDRTER